MCGICCFIGRKPVATATVIEGLDSLQHRGYDSAGICRLAHGAAEVYKISTQEKADFKASDLLGMIPGGPPEDHIAIGHNRWATIGAPTRTNAHPHHDSRKLFYLVHNGNVENLQEVEERAGSWGRYSGTDTEAIANLVSAFYSEGKNFAAAVKQTIDFLEGENVIAVLKADEADKLIVANRGRTVLLGRSDSGNIIASDPLAFRSFAIKNLTEVSDNEVAIVTADDWQIIGSNPAEARRKKAEVENGLAGITEELSELLALCPDNAAKGKISPEFAYHMECEILEQPESFQRALLSKPAIGEEASIEDIAGRCKNAETVHFIGCGTSYNACLYAKLLFNHFGMPAHAWIASEFNYCPPVFKPDDAFVFLSQSGETADVLQVVNLIKAKGNFRFGMINEEKTIIWKEMDAAIGIKAGEEIGVASTKAYTSQLASIVVFALCMARLKGLSVENEREILLELAAMPDKIRMVLAGSERIKMLAKRYSRFKNYYFLGRCFNTISAFEGSLKLKEISYVHAEAYPLGEMKHGPLSLIDKDFCSIAIVPNDRREVSHKGIVNLYEIKARGGNVLAIGNESLPLSMVDAAIYVPETLEILTPLITIIPLQLFAYYMALRRKNNPDKPRNLAKTVTVG